MKKMKKPCKYCDFADKGNHIGDEYLCLLKVMGKDKNNCRFNKFVFNP